MTPLSDLIQKFLVNDRDYTDIHIESDSPVMVRLGAYAWEQAMIDGEPVIACEQQILAFLNATYGGEEIFSPHTGENTSWYQQLVRQGSLHTSTVLSELSDDGATLVEHQFRCAVQRQSMGERIAMVLRSLRDVPESMETLGLPLHFVKRVKEARQGLIVVTGPTGSGKSTTIAAVLEYFNKYRTSNILTIEDPVEFKFERRKSIINQREIGIDVPDFATGVKDALRFVPDVIMVGEIRDSATMRATMRAAESGHLVITSLHAPSAEGALRRIASLMECPIESFIPNIVCVLAQAMCPSTDSPPRNVLACELLDCDSVVLAQHLSDIGEALRKNRLDASFSMASSLQHLIDNGKISREVALRYVPGLADRGQLQASSRQQTMEATS